MKTTNRNNQSSEARLGVTRFYTSLSFFSGLTYPTPKFAKHLPTPVRLAWRAITLIGESAIIFMLISNVMLLTLEGRNSIAVQTESIGSIVLATYVTIKTTLLYRTKTSFTKIVQNVHKVAQEFENNPIGRNDYLESHAKHFKSTLNYCKAKSIVNLVSVYGLVFDHLIHGLLTDDKNERITPMLGWFPFEFDTRLKFASAILAQGLYYPLLLIRDSTIDIVYMTILSVISHQFLYLGELLGTIIATNPDKPKTEQKRIMLWWLIQHQKLLKIVENFQKITQIWLFLNYAYISFIFFLVLLRLTVDKDFIIQQQIVIIGVNATNLVHLFVISSLGDDIAENSTQIKFKLFRNELFSDKTNQQRTALLITMRCSKPVQLKFADNRVLAIKSFADIMKSLLGYFATIYQLRN